MPSLMAFVNRSLMKTRMSSLDFVSVLATFTIGESASGTCYFQASICSILCRCAFRDAIPREVRQCPSRAESPAGRTGGCALFRRRWSLGHRSVRRVDRILCRSALFGLCRRRRDITVMGITGPRPRQRV